MICFETMNCFILCGQRETKSYLFLTQRWSNGLATLCSVRKVLTLKMILCRLFCMSSTAAGNVGPGIEYWQKHCVGSENDRSLYRAEVHWKPTDDTLPVWCHLPLWNQFQWHFSISLECYYQKKYWKDLVKEVCLEMSLTPKIVESNFLDLARVHLVKPILRVRKIDVWFCSLLPSLVLRSLCILIFCGFPYIS